MPLKVKVHKQLSSYRRRAGMSVSDVVHRTGIARSTVYQYEFGAQEGRRATLPSPGRMLLLIDLYGLTPIERLDLLEAYMEEDAQQAAAAAEEDEDEDDTDSLSWVLA